MSNPKENDLVVPTLIFNVAALALLTSLGFVVRAPWLLLLGLAVATLLISNLLWVYLFLLRAVGVLLIFGVIRGLLRRLFNRTNDQPPTPREPGLQQKITQGMGASSLPLIVVPMVFLFGVVLVDAATERSVSTLYKISISHCCVGLVGWVLALRNKIGPLQFALGDADS